MKIMLEATGNLTLTLTLHLTKSPDRDVLLKEDFVFDTIG